MKRRLQELWDEVVPTKGPSPQPETKAVLARVEASLEDKPRWGRRSVKLVVILAAVLVLTMTTVSATYALSGHNIFDIFFTNRGTEYEASLADVEPISVSDDNYVLTVTSSLSDEKTIYCTLEVQAKTERARNYLKMYEPVQTGEPNPDDFLKEDPIEIDMAWSGFPGMFHYRCNHEGILEGVDLSIDQWGDFQDGRTLKVRIKDMKEGLWLEFPVRALPTTKIKIGSDGWGAGLYGEGPVHLESVELSPLGIMTNYTKPKEYSGGSPTLYILWKDGSFSTMGELGTYGSGKFRAVQDITKMEAVVFENMAYPLDGGAAYPVDASDLPRPFLLPLSPKIPTNDGGYIQQIPIFFLCEKLGIPCDWDAETGTAEMTYRGVTITVQAGSSEVLVDGELNQGDLVPEAPAVLKDEELWGVIDYPAWGLLYMDSHDHSITAWDGVETFRLIVP